MYIQKPKCQAYHLSVEARQVRCNAGLANLSAREQQLFPVYVETKLLAFGHSYVRSSTMY